MYDYWMIYMLSNPFNFNIFRSESHISEKKAIKNWLDTVCNHDPSEIVKLYAPDGVLLGTVAKTIKIGRTEIKKYFDIFVKKKPCGKITSMNVQSFGDIAIVDGTYTFDLTDEGKRNKVLARYTFVLRKKNNQWVIASHHSSAQP